MLWALYGECIQDTAHCVNSMVNSIQNTAWYVNSMVNSIRDIAHHVNSMVNRIRAWCVKSRSSTPVTIFKGKNWSKNFIRYRCIFIFASIFLKIATSTQNAFLHAFSPFTFEIFYKIGTMANGQPTIGRTIGRKYWDKEIVAPWSKVLNIASGRNLIKVPACRTPVESTNRNFWT